MVLVVSLTAIVLPMLLAAAFLLGRHFHRRQQSEEEFSPVTRQHFELFQSGRFNEAAVESVKNRFSAMLERGEEATVEASLRPGMHYVFQVRALAEIGTDVAGRILERQLKRRLSNDHLEQAWYWIDLAGSLRFLNREESLPHLLNCADTASEAPLGHFFAAETICFLGFAGYLHHTETPLGHSALRLLHRALEGLRYGVQPQLVPEARLGEIIEQLWDHRPDTVHPLFVRVVHESLRYLRRAPHARATLTDENNDREAFDWQLARIEALEPSLRDYLSEAPAVLVRQLKSTCNDDFPDLLHALRDLRIDTGAELLPLFSRPRFPHKELALEVIAWSSDPGVGPWLRGYAARHIPMNRRSRWKPHASVPRRPSLPADVPYHGLLRALRRQPSVDNEKFLLLAAKDWDPTYRAAALSGLGWWSPILRSNVLEALKESRLDPNPDVRQAARAALARLGQRQALHWFRQALTREDFTNIHDAIQLIAAEGLTLLWPDLDRLADSENPDIAHLARESLERMAEDMEHRRAQ
ncbi:MAG: HEAT repeat domain-containing protein [Planctomycetes bacterium]|nr:HEAT repeat domain-containing protein [Planctomycetota bacterium]